MEKITAWEVAAQLKVEGSLAPGLKDAERQVEQTKNKVLESMRQIAQAAAGQGVPVGDIRGMLQGLGFQGVPRNIAAMLSSPVAQAAQAQQAASSALTIRQTQSQRSAIQDAEWTWKTKPQAGVPGLMRAGGGGPLVPTGPGGGGGGGMPPGGGGPSGGGTPAGAATVATGQLNALGKSAQAASSNLGSVAYRAAWVLRSATSGGIAGVSGSILGGLAGLAFGTPLTGALMGNTVGQRFGEIGGGASDRNRSDVEAGHPGLAYQRQVAEREASGARGRAFVDTYQETSAVERRWRDFFASGGRDMSGYIGKAFDRAGNAISKLWLGILEEYQSIKPKSGAGVGAAASPLAGHFFHSGDDLFQAAQTAALQSGVSPNAFNAFTPARLAEAKAANEGDAAALAGMPDWFGNAPDAARGATRPGNITDILRQSRDMRNDIGSVIERARREGPAGMPPATTEPWQSIISPYIVR